MKNKLMEDTIRLENALAVCGIAPQGAELPQVATPNDIIVDLICRSTGKTSNVVDAEINNQTTTAYQ